MVSPGSQQPGSQPPPSPLGRTSLTGEAMPDLQPARPPLTTERAFPPPRPAGIAPRPLAGRAAGSPENPARSGAAGVVVAIVVALILAVAAGGWYYWNHRTNPQQQAQKFLDAEKALDFQKMEDLTTADGVATLKAAQQKLGQSAVAKSFVDSITAGITLTAGQAEVTGDTATVPVAISGSVFGRSISKAVDLKMVCESGIWKVDAKSGGNGVGALGGSPFGSGTGGPGIPGGG